MRQIFPLVILLAACSEPIDEAKDIAVVKMVQEGKEVISKLTKEAKFRGLVVYDRNPTIAEYPLEYATLCGEVTVNNEYIKFYYKGTDFKGILIKAQEGEVKASHAINIGMYDNFCKLKGENSKIIEIAP
jgi:hypothetical protein